MNIPYTTQLEWDKASLTAFEFEDAEEPKNHFMGSHWDPILKNFDNSISEIIQKMETSTIRESLKLPSFNFNPSVSISKIVYLDYKMNDNSQVNYVISVEEDASLASMFPKINDGTIIKETLFPNSVYIWSAKNEAQINCNLGNASISFYDTNFANNYMYYAAGCTYLFKLRGLSYGAKRNDMGELDIEMTDSNRAFLFSDEMSGSKKVDLSRMKMLIPIDEWDIDDYKYAGEIIELNEINILGINGWMCNVSVTTETDFFDGNLKIFISTLAWKDETPPEIGDYIQGSMWLHGEMIAPFVEANEEVQEIKEDYPVYDLYTQDPHQMCLDAYARMYNRLDASGFEPYLDGNVIYSSQNVLESLEGKDNVLNYFIGKVKTIKNSGGEYKVFAQRAYIGTPDNPCVLMAQQDIENNLGVILMKTHNGKIIQIDMCSVAPSPKDATLLNIYPINDPNII